MELTYVRLLVTKFRECFVFYRDVLGLETSFPEHDGPYAEFALGGDKYLALFVRTLQAAAVDTADKPVSADAQDAVALIFRVPNADEAAERLRAKGVVIDTEATDRPAWGLRTVHLRDPDGNLIELCHDIPMEDGGSA